MITLLLLAVAVHVGGAPSEWQPVQGAVNLDYRWSLPYSNACVVEFSSKDATAARQFQLITRVVSSRPAPMVQPNADNPMKIAPTKVKQQTSDRNFSIKVFASSRTSETLHDCYGVQTVETTNSNKTGVTKSEPLSDRHPR